MKKTFLVIGTGEFGYYVCKKLYELGYEIMAVDQDEKHIEAVLPYTVNSLIGDATNLEFLKSLGVENFDVCFVTVGDRFQDSLEITSLLKENGAKKVVSRASREIQQKFLLRNGADHVIYPEYEMANWAAIRYSADNILDYIELPGDNSIFEFSVPVHWVGKTILEIDVRKNYHVNIIGLVRNGVLSVEFDPTTVLRKEDSIMVTGKDQAIEACFHMMNRGFRSE